MSNNVINIPTDESMANGLEQIANAIGGNGITYIECEIGENGITSTSTYEEVVEAFSTGTVILHATQEDEDLSVDGYIPILLAISVVYEQQESCILVVATQGEQSPALIRSIGAPTDTISIGE